jgi:hypothetical protein
MRQPSKNRSGGKNNETSGFSGTSNKDSAAMTAPNAICNSGVGTASGSEQHHGRQHEQNEPDDLHQVLVMGTAPLRPASVTGRRWR